MALALMPPLTSWASNCCRRFALELQRSAQDVARLAAHRPALPSSSNALAICERPRGFGNGRQEPHRCKLADRKVGKVDVLGPRSLAQGTGGVALEAKLLAEQPNRDLAPLALVREPAPRGAAVLGPVRNAERDLPRWGRRGRRWSTSHRRRTARDPKLCTKKSGRNATQGR